MYVYSINNSRKRSHIFEREQHAEETWESGGRKKDWEKIRNSILLLKTETKEELWNEKVFSNCISDEELVFQVNVTQLSDKHCKPWLPSSRADRKRLLLLRHCFYCFGFTFDVTIPKWQFRDLFYLLFIFKQENQILCYCYVVIQGIFSLVLMNIF